MKKVKGLVSRVESRKREIALRSKSNPRPSTLDPRPIPDPRPRRGMTLIELLVVIVIITTLVAAAIPILSPTNSDRSQREASRQVNTFITGAQARAISLRRPVGVALKRLSYDTHRAEDNGVCLELFYVEELPPYTGFDANSRASVAIYPNPPNQFPNAVLVRFVTRGTTGSGLSVGWAVDLFPEATIHPGDVVEVNGTQFRLLFDPRIMNFTNVSFDPSIGCYTRANTNFPVTIAAVPVNNTGQQINPRYDNQGNEIGAAASAQSPYWTLPAPYKVLRQPTSMSDEPLQLPEGTTIDLRASGVGQNDYFYVPNMHDNSEGVLIMFTPEGRVGRVAFYRTPFNVQPYDQPVAENVYLLIGRRDRIAAPDVANDPTLRLGDVTAVTTDEQRAKLREPVNWLNGDSRWIVIGAQTGRVATIENAAVDLANVLQAPSKPFSSASESTEEMRCAQILAARELTREMAQVGGR